MVICINFHLKFDNIHVIYLFTCRLLSTIRLHKNKSDDKSDDNVTTIKYVILNKWVNARQEIVVSRFLRAARDF